MSSQLISHTEARSILATRPTVVELFTGVGGMSLGLDQAGFHSAVAVEIEEMTGRYAQYNLPATTVLYGSEHGDVRNFGIEALRQVAPSLTDEIALVAGGPPCQGFSMAGKKSNADPLNDLVFEFARIVKELRPLAFLMENVPGITRGTSQHLAEALSDLEELYSVAEPTSRWACDFGVPQMRERIFVLGIRKDLGIDPSLPDPQFTRPIGGKQASMDFFNVTPTVWDAISDIPAVDDYPELIDGDRIPYDKLPVSEYSQIMRRISHDLDDLSLTANWDEQVCTNLRRTQHGNELLERFHRLEFGRMDKLSGIRRLDPDHLSTTIRAGTTRERGAWSAPRPVHPFQDRVLTTRECARIQSFPDWFFFHPVKWHGNRQVGNAVPPLLARAIGKHILSLLGLPRAVESLPVVLRDESLVEADIKEAAMSGLSRRKVSQKVIHPRLSTVFVEEMSDINA